MPSNSSLGLIPTRAAAAALYSLDVSSGLFACASHRLFSACRIGVLLNASEREPPTCCNSPFSNDGCLAWIVIVLAHLALLTCACSAHSVLGRNLPPAC